MSRRGKPSDRSEVVVRLQDKFAEHFDAGVGIFSWEEGGETHFVTLKFGNSFTVDAMIDQLRGCIEAGGEEENDEEDEEE
jgi:hypothetical protein